MQASGPGFLRIERNYLKKVAKILMTNRKTTKSG